MLGVLSFLLEICVRAELSALLKVDNLTLANGDRSSKKVEDARATGLNSCNFQEAHSDV